MPLVQPLLLPKNVHFVSEYYPNTKPYYNDINLAVSDAESGDLVLVYLPVQNYIPKAGVRVFFYWDDEDSMKPSDFANDSLIIKKTISGEEVFTGITTTELAPLVTVKEISFKASQSGTDDPVGTQSFRNNTTITYAGMERQSVGLYTILFSGALASSTLAYELINQILTDPDGVPIGYLTWNKQLSTTTDVVINTLNLSYVPTDSLMTNAMIRILIA